MPVAATVRRGAGALCQCLSRASSFSLLVFACPKKSNQKKGPPDGGAPESAWRTPGFPALLGFEGALSTGHPVPTREDGPSMARPLRALSLEACDARRRRRGSGPSSVRVATVCRSLHRRDGGRRALRWNGTPSVCTVVAWRPDPRWSRRASEGGADQDSAAHAGGIFSRVPTRPRSAGDPQSAQRAEGGFVGGPFLLPTSLWASKEKYGRARARKTLARCHRPARTCRRSLPVPASEQSVASRGNADSRETREQRSLDAARGRPPSRRRWPRRLSATAPAAPPCRHPSPPPAPP